MEVAFFLFKRVYTRVRHRYECYMCMRESIHGAVVKGLLYLIYSTVTTIEAIRNYAYTSGMCKSHLTVCVYQADS